jgi:hypothetical protein
MRGGKGQTRPQRGPRVGQEIANQPGLVVKVEVLDPADIAVRGAELPAVELPDVLEHAPIITGYLAPGYGV